MPASPDRRLEKERQELQRIAPEPGTAVNHSVYLSMFQLYEIERMAFQGMDLEQMRRRLGIPPQVWDAMKLGNPELAKAYFDGRDRMVDVSSGTMMQAVQTGDITAARFMLERFGGTQYRPPSQKIEVEPKTPPTPTIDVVASVEGSFEVQRRLLAKTLGRPIQDVPDDAPGAGAGALGAGAGAPD